VESFRQVLRDKDTPDPQLKQAARQLDTLLMQPIRPLLGNTRYLLLALDGALNLIPFEALVDENGNYLVETYSFSYLTAGRDLLRLQAEQTNTPSTQPVILANPFFQKPGDVVAAVPPDNQSDNTRSIDLSQLDISPLDGTKLEAEAIASLLGVTSLLGSQATEAAVKQANRPRLLHIATHGFFEPAPTTPEAQATDNPFLRAGLVLAGVNLRQSGGEGLDGILTAMETASLNLVGTKLVVLSACNTGVGDISAGEGIYGLRRALVLAGSQSQVISLWKVDDTATKGLMVAYYNRVLVGEGRGEALRQEQLAMLKGDT
jgi:CHAT domain-containing protein